jgi:hypothetical protein
MRASSVLKWPTPGGANEIVISKNSRKRVITAAFLRKNLNEFVRSKRERIGNAEIRTLHEFIPYLLTKQAECVTNEKILVRQKVRLQNACTTEELIGDCKNRTDQSVKTSRKLNKQPASALASTISRLLDALDT